MLQINNINSENIIDSLIQKINTSKKEYIISGKIKNELLKIGHILNISWFINSINNPIAIICPRSTNCPIENQCKSSIKSEKKISWLNEVKNEIINKS